MLATVIVKIVPMGPDGGVALILTETVPVMPSDWWNVQWYWYFPPAVKANVKVLPTGTLPESQRESGVLLVEVWATVPPFVHFTLSPKLMDDDFGVKTYSVMVTFAVAARALPWRNTTSSTDSNADFLTKRMSAPF